jgi:hypothetical protein
MVAKAGLRILHAFENDNSRTFTELCKSAGYPTDLGGYYLRQLVSGDYLGKGERGEYILSPKGRKYVATRHSQLQSTPRLHILVVSEFDNKYVVLERHQQPFLNRTEWPATALKGGEQVQKALDRIFKERLAQTQTCDYVGTFRRIDLYQDELFDDKVFLVFKAMLIAKPPTEVVNGLLHRVAEKELGGIPHKSRSLLDIFNFMKTQEQYLEKAYSLTYDDFEPEGSYLAH